MLEHQIVKLTMKTGMYSVQDFQLVMMSQRLGDQGRPFPGRKRWISALWGKNLQRKIWGFSNHLFSGKELGISRYLG